MEQRVKGEVAFTIDGGELEGSPQNKYVEFNGSPYFIEAVFKAIEICSKKNADYTANAHPLANFLLAKEFGIDPVDGLLLRMLDKIQRIKSYKTQGKLQVGNESLIDAFMDLGNYSFLMIALMKYLEEQDYEVNF